MHVVFISNSQGKAERKVRTVLDAYCNRIGATAWSSPMTEEALEEIRRALKKGISRYTSVACYRNRGTNALELLWQVGNRGKYDAYGRFAPETKAKKPYIAPVYRHAALVADIGGLGHDLGKANSQFQFKIGNSSTKPGPTELGDGIRHEWLSAWLFEKMIDSGMELTDAANLWSSSMRKIVKDSWMPIPTRIESAKDACSAIIATHHHCFEYGSKASPEKLQERPSRLLVQNSRHVSETITDAQRKRLQVIDYGPETQAWAKHGEYIAKQFNRLRGIQDNNPDYWHGVTLIARAALVLADHEISALDKCDGPRSVLYANTAKGNKLNQPLLWHLQNVGKAAKRNICMFANADLPTLPREVTQQILARSDKNSRFAWQDDACDALHKNHALVFNVASTGAGKTRANMKIACALRDGESVRVSSAFNLRSLTLQTHSAYCSELAMRKEHDCACLVGSAIIRELHENSQDNFTHDLDSDADTSGSISDVDLIGTEELAIPVWLEHEIARISNSEKGHGRLKKLLASPVLVSTIDYLNAAGDMTKPNADHAHALLRMAHSDLILDELDSYDPDSVVAVLRLIQIAAMFGRNVIISSATLSPSIALYARQAFEAGCKAHQAMFGGLDNAVVAVVSDLAAPTIQALSEPDFETAYSNHLTEMVAANAKRTKLFKVVGTGLTLDDFHLAIANSAMELHKNNDWALSGHPDTRVSVGLIRMANIDPLLEVAQQLVESQNPECQIHVVTYHAREALLRRAWKEKQFDLILSRKKGNAALEQAMIEQLKIQDEFPKNAIFIMVASPVEEVGRDHDFDWAVIEPSSMHSIIQTAGRVNRHRLIEVDKPNIAVLNMNYRTMNGKAINGCVFIRPGYQTRNEATKQSTHFSTAMTDLLGIDQVKIALNQEAIMNIGMMFGPGRVEFAQADERSIQYRMKKVVNDYISTNGHAVWFGKWFAAAYPLRAESRQALWSVAPGKVSGFSFWEYGNKSRDIKNKNTSGQKWEWIERKSVKQQSIEDHKWLCRAWLSPTVQEIWVNAKPWLGLIKKLTEDDMSFTVQVYNKDDPDQPERSDWKGIILK